MDLDTNVIEKINPYLERFILFMVSEEGKDWGKERVERKKWFQEDLSEVNLSALDDSTLGQVVESLWANMIWSDKRYLIGKILENGIDNIQKWFRTLLYGSDSMSKRFNDFRNHIKYIGPSSMTEILAFVHPDNYPIWNEKTRKALRFLGLDVHMPERAYKYQINGNEYEKCIEVMGVLKQHLQSHGLHDADFIELNFFLAFVDDEAAPLVEEAVTADEEPDFDHDEVCQLLAAIGTNLGFDVETPKKIARGAIVDAYWSTRIGSLGAVAYVFEVQKGGSIDSLILNLLRARNDPKVQRIVVVANESKLQKVREEVESVHGDFQRYLAYLDVRDVFKLEQMLTDVNTILSSLKIFQS